ncbi:MAG: CHAT domain-containing protein [Cyanobacteriota bacterium]|nr:CHAT domain-containing protein [Cyanobacteriota bacterium]
MKEKLAIVISILCFGASDSGFATAVSSFSESCLERESLDEEERKTIEVLLEIADTADCQAANENLMAMDRLDLSDRQISHLKPLSFFPNLRTLYLGQNQITDLSPVTNLSQLTDLYLPNNQISDLAPLSGLENLTTLYLDNNQIRDIRPLSNLRSLEILYANRNQIQNLDPVANLPNLAQLYLAENQITDIQPLRSLLTLTHLNLGNNRITQIDPIASLKRTVQLSLNDNGIANLNPLASLENVTELDLRNNPILRKTCPVFPATVCLFSDDAAELFRQGEEQAAGGDFRLALTTFETALQVYRDVGHSLRESDALDRIGNLYDELGEYANALDFYQQASTIRNQIGDRQGQSDTLANLGITYIRIGQTEKAIDSLQEALSLYRELTSPDRSGLRQEPREGKIFSNLALAYRKLGDTAPALRFAKQSLASYRRRNDRNGEVVALNRVGEAYLDAGNSEKARLYLEKALNLSRERNDRPGMGRSWHGLGRLAASLGDTQTALERYQQARDARRNSEDSAGEGETLNAMGELLLQSGKSAEAAQALESAVALWESLRPGLTDADKISIAETQAQTYRLLQQALIDRGEIEAALEVSERGRARAFAELLAHRLQLQGKTLPPDTSEPPNIDRIQQIARDRNTTLVEYSLVQNDSTGEELYIWVIEPTGKIHFRRRLLEGKSLTTWVEDNRWALGVRGRGEAIVVERIEDWEPASQGDRLHQLYQLLIEPIADLLPQDADAPVTIVPQGELFLVPFAALPDENGIDLLDKHPLLFAPAIGSIAATPSADKPLDIGGDPALIIGNPTMPDDPATGFPLRSLSGAEAEALDIAPILDRQPLIGEEATQAAVKSQLGDAAIAHFATHGLLDDFGTGVPGALALTPTATDNGFLTAAEILTLPLKARLVVLSACDTGRGNITGDGVVGLSRSFLTAGVESVVVSLWAVDDESTAFLMGEFYRQLQQNPDRAIALRQAMLTTREEYPHPSRWAAFALFGQMGGSNLAGESSIGD